MLQCPSAQVRHAAMFLGPGEACFGVPLPRQDMLRCPSAQVRHAVMSLSPGRWLEASVGWAMLYMSPAKLDEGAMATGMELGDITNPPSEGNHGHPGAPKCLEMHIETAFSETLQGL